MPRAPELGVGNGPPLLDKNGIFRFWGAPRWVYWGGGSPHFLWTLNYLILKLLFSHKDFAGDIVCGWRYSDNKSFYTLE